MTLDPQATYVHLRKDGSAIPVDGGAAFWSRPEQDLASFGRDWLVSEYAFDADWSNWEMHPEADELVYLLSGAIEMHLDHGTRYDRVLLRDSGLVIVPRGIWHTAKVLAPSRVLHVTMGAGTRHRAAASDLG
ncbi:MAG TPA: cupin [Noviherbaspirillum sp.]|jgi:mannose-6-phosphate isomerase-like protein (cupin superfamily)|uniref:cupin n=1 Tax=Noviherbaspirillum sp. TaxID=1926288 RepID=UPI002F949DEB